MRLREVSDVSSMTDAAHVQLARSTLLGFVQTTGNLQQLTGFMPRSMRPSHAAQQLTRTFTPDTQQDHQIRCNFTEPEPWCCICDCWLVQAIHFLQEVCTVCKLTMGVWLTAIRKEAAAHLSRYHSPNVVLCMLFCHKEE